jgi:beta-barrel assembly-enhancing protease
MKNFANRLCALFLVNTMLGLTCISPVYGFSVGEEREVGEKLLYSVRSTFHLLDDPDIHQYINSLGQEILTATGPQYFEFRFFVIKDKEFNAFAAFSGMIFFYSGLIESMNSENELFAVMAHEIGHTTKRHLASRIEKGTAVSIGTVALALASLAMGGGVATQALFAGSLATGQSLNLHFSRSDENEADLLAYDWMKKLGRNPDSMEKMLQTMRRITRYRSGKVPQYLLTHPDPEARLDYIDSLLVNDKQKLGNMTKGDQFAFLRFKYRVMSLANDGSIFRSFLAEKIANPNSSQFDIDMARYGLSQLDREEKNFDSSLQMIEDVIKAFPDKKILLDDKGVIELAAGKVENALKTLTKAYQDNPGDLYATFSLAKAQFMANNFSEAEKLLLKTISVMPEYSQAFFELGRVKASQKKDGDSMYYLGKFYFLTGKTKLAKQMFKTAANKNDTDATFKNDALESIKTIDRIEGNK